MTSYCRSIRVRLLNTAAVDFRFLLSRNYPRKSALNFVGNRYQLDSMERNLLFRGVFTRRVAAERRSKMVRVGEIRGNRVVIDTYNCLITLENALRGLPVVLADDGFVRDAGLVFRGFRPSGRTRIAWGYISSVLKRYPPSFTLLLLDAPYAGSGDLSATLNKWMKEDGLAGRASTTAKNEKEIAAMEGIKISADSVVLDFSDRVFDLAGHIIRRIIRKKPLMFT